MSAERSGENRMSPTCLPSILTGNDAPISGKPRRSTNQCGTGPSGVRTSTGEGIEVSAPVGRNRMVSDVPSDCTKASSVCCGLAEISSALLSASATRFGGARRRLVLFHQLDWREQLQRNGPEQQR